MTTKQNRTPEKPLPLDLYQAVADDMLRYHKLSQPKMDYERMEKRQWVRLDQSEGAETKRIPRQNARQSFPPQNLSGIKSAADIIRELTFAFERLQERPRELVDLSGTEALARIIDIPRVTGEALEELASGEKQLGSGLGSEINRIFGLGLEKQLPAFVVKANKADPAIVDLPFKMDALPYTGRLPDHAQLLNDIFARHKSHAAELAQSLRVTGLTAEVIQYISLYHKERDLFPDDAPEPVFGRALSRKLDQDIFSMESGPFSHYCAARMDIQHKPDPVHDGRRVPDPVQTYDYPITERFTYAELYRTDEKRPAYTERQKNLKGKQDAFFRNLQNLTQGELGHSADLVDLGISFPAATGRKKLSGKEKTIVDQHSELQQAGIEKVDQAALAAQEFATLEERRNFRSFSSIRENWLFANQKGRGTKDFARAFAQAMVHIHQNIADLDRANPDTLLGGTFYPISAQTNHKGGAATYYVAATVVDSMINNGLLVARKRSGKYSDYANRAIPV